MARDIMLDHKLLDRKYSMYRISDEHRLHSRVLTPEEKARIQKQNRIAGLSFIAWLFITICVLCSIGNTYPPNSVVDKIVYGWAKGTLLLFFCIGIYCWLDGRQGKKESLEEQKRKTQDEVSDAHMPSYTLKMLGVRTTLKVARANLQVKRQPTLFNRFH